MPLAIAINRNRNLVQENKDGVAAMSRAAVEKVIKELQKQGGKIVKRKQVKDWMQKERRRRRDDYLDKTGP